MKKRVFIILAAAVLTTQTICCMNKSEEPIIQKEPNVEDIGMGDKPDWLKAIRFCPESKRIDIYCNFADMANRTQAREVVQECKELKKLLENLSYEKSFTKVDFEEVGKYLIENDRLICKTFIIEAIRNSTTNIRLISYLDRVSFCTTSN